jgi:hypothetical protein
MYYTILCIILYYTTVLLFPPQKFAWTPCCYYSRKTESATVSWLIITSYRVSQKNGPNLCNICVTCVKERMNERTDTRRSFRKEPGFLEALNTLRVKLTSRFFLSIGVLCSCSSTRRLQHVHVVTQYNALRTSIVTAQERWKAGWCMCCSSN